MIEPEEVRELVSAASTATATATASNTTISSSYSEHLGLNDSIRSAIGKSITKVDDTLAGASRRVILDRKTLSKEDVRSEQARDSTVNHQSRANLHIVLSPLLSQYVETTTTASKERKLCSSGSCRLSTSSSALLSSGNLNCGYLVKSSDDYCDIDRVGRGQGEAPLARELEVEWVPIRGNRHEVRGRGGGGGKNEEEEVEAIRQRGTSNLFKRIVRLASSTRSSRSPNIRTSLVGGRSIKSHATTTTVPRSTTEGIRRTIRSLVSADWITNDTVNKSDRVSYIGTYSSQQQKGASIRDRENQESNRQQESGSGKEHRRICNNRLNNNHDADVPLPSSSEILLSNQQQDKQKQHLQAINLRNSLSCEFYSCNRNNNEEKESSKLISNNRQLDEENRPRRILIGKSRKRAEQIIEDIVLGSQFVGAAVDGGGNDGIVIPWHHQSSAISREYHSNSSMKSMKTFKSGEINKTKLNKTRYIESMEGDNRLTDYCSPIGVVNMNMDCNNSSLTKNNHSCHISGTKDETDKRLDISNDCKHPSRSNITSSNYKMNLRQKEKNNDHDDGGEKKNDPDPDCHHHDQKSSYKRGIVLKERENWSMNIEFLLAVIGFAVDLGNVWRFPYICYRNGGGAFLIPYTIMFFLGGLPIFYLEMSLGQYFSSGCLTVWKRVCPMAKGIGYAMCVLNFFTGLYYNTIISWAVFFFVESFTTVLPWTSCNNPWNSPGCRTIDQRQAIKSNYSLNELDRLNDTTIYSTPTKDYFEREVLQVHLSDGIDDLGSIRKPLAIYLAIVFICIYFAIWKGVKSTGKAVWITALLPYFVLIPLLIRGVFLEGAWLGIRYYLYPQWLKIFDVDVWVEAAKQIYFSLGPGFGTLMALSSYNKFNHNCQRDALIAASVNYFASFISGLVIFAVLGYMATIENAAISDVATEGPGLVFQVYPEGLATMRYSAMWSVLFFIMVITLGIDSTFGGLESVITGLCDEYPRTLRAHRGVFIGFLIVLIYFCSLPTTTYGGNYVIYVLESYGTSLSLLFIVLVETIIVCWLYGADRFCKNLEEMYGQMPGAYWRICWKYISPTILLLIFFAACGQELDKYHTLTNGSYIYPGWAPTIGLLMTGSSVCCIPIYAIYYLRTKTSGTFLQRLKIASRPVEGDQREGKEIHGDTMTDKISDENTDIHLNVVI